MATGQLSFPENFKIVDGYNANVGAAAVVTGAYISVKNCQRIWVVIKYRQADGTSITWNVTKATAVAGTNATVTDVLMPVWSNLSTATNDTLVRRTDAVNYASGTGTGLKVVIFEVDPDALGQLSGTPYSAICGASTTAIAAGQYVDITYYVQPRYQSKASSAPTLVTD